MRAESAIRIPVFVSAPSVLNTMQQAVYDYVANVLNDEGLQPRALGRSDFPESDPVTEVYYIARACYGGIILGFSQIEVTNGTIRKGADAAIAIAQPMALPTPWNQLEAGILSALRKPLLVFAEKGVTGGVFDRGALRGYVQEFDPARMEARDWERIRERIRHWTATVRTAFRS